jgi:5-methylcytosine-specific restriction endonuclease McrA
MKAERFYVMPGSIAHRTRSMYSPANRRASSDQRLAVTPAENRAPEFAGEAAPERDRRPLSEEGIEALAREAWTAAPARGNDWGAFVSWCMLERVGLRNLRRAQRWAEANLLPYAGAGAELRTLRSSWNGEGFRGADITPEGRACRYCDDPATAIDHVWPQARGGNDHPNNLVPTCKPCNSRKRDRSLLTERCAACRRGRDPGDVDTATGKAFYACRCGASWSKVFDLQHMRL